MSKILPHVTLQKIYHLHQHSKDCIAALSVNQLKDEP